MRGILPAALAILLWAVASDVHAQTRVDLLFSSTYLGYEGSQLKENGAVVGAYGYLGHGLSHVVEGAAAQTWIDFRDGTRLSQLDLSAAYTHYLEKTTLRAGAHYLSSTDPLTDGSTVFFGSVGRYVPYVGNANVEVSYSSYPDYDGGLTVTQVSPGAGRRWAAVLGSRWVYVDVRGYFIHLSRDVNLADRSFASLQASVDYHIPKATFSAFAWVGTQAFAVRQGGFTVYNLPEKHTGGYGGSLRYIFSPKAAATLGLYNERFQDIGFDEDVSATILQLSVGFTL